MEILLRAFGFMAHIQIGREGDEEPEPDSLVDTVAEQDRSEQTEGPQAGFARR